MLELARKLSTLRGERYAGAVIAKVEWRRDDDRKAASESLRIVKDRHGLVTAEAKDGTATLLATLLLHGAIRNPSFADPLEKQNKPREYSSSDIWHAFSKAEIMAFVKAAEDTNELHRGDHPIVPGLLILKHLLAEESFCNCTRLRLKFHHVAFAGEPLRLTQSKDSLQILSHEKLLCDGAMNLEKNETKDV